MKVSCPIISWLCVCVLDLVSVCVSLCVHECMLICASVQKLAKPLEAYLHADLTVRWWQWIALTNWPIIGPILLAQPWWAACGNHAHEMLSVQVSYSHLSSTISVCCLLTLNQAGLCLLCLFCLHKVSLRSSFLQFRSKESNLKLVLLCSKFEVIFLVC